MYFRTFSVLFDCIKPCSYSILFQTAQEVATLVHNVLCNFLFANVKEDIRPDHIALDLQRSRDHNLPAKTTSGYR